MKYLLELSGENIELAKYEALSISDIKNYKLINKYFIIETKNNLSRLSYTKKIYKLLFTTTEDKLKNKIKSFNWQKYYKKNFVVRSNKSNLESELASLIWNKLEKPKVNLTKPITQFEFLFLKNKVYALLLLNKIPSFTERKPHLRPGFSPVSLHPKLARAMVNLTKIKPKQILLDPFCGTGGILIEAALVGCKVIGSDIDQKMLEKTKLNLEYFNLKGKLIHEDATKIKIKVDAIATDPPYGIASSLHKKDINTLYNEFLQNAYKILKPKKYLVMIIPNKLKIKSKFKTIKKMPYYVHKSLTRNIIVLKKP